MLFDLFCAVLDPTTSVVGGVTENYAAIKASQAATRRLSEIKDSELKSVQIDYYRKKLKELE